MFHPSSEHEPVTDLTVEQFAAKFPSEGQYIEFKEGASRDRIAEAAVAFSNADGGVILLGVSDDGTTRGIDLDIHAETRLHQTLGQVRDLGTYGIQRFRVAAQSLVAIGVGRRRGGFAQLPSGQVKERRGASNYTLLGIELADFIARRFVRSVELAPTAWRSDDIDPDLADKLAAAWRWPAPSDSFPTLLDCLRDNGFLVLNGDGERLSVAGALFLVTDTGAYLGKPHVEVFRYRDDGLDYDRRKEFRGQLQDQVGEAARFVGGELGFDLALLGAKRHELDRLPHRVVREAIANAIAHRSYMATNEAVRIELRPDRVVVRSPGGLPDGVTLERLSDQSVPRNVLIIRTLRFFGIAEDAGRGVDLMRDHMALNLMDPPEFEADESSVTVTLRLGSRATPTERAWLANTLTKVLDPPTRPYSVGDHGSTSSAIEPGDALLLVKAARGEKFSNAVVRELLGVDRGRANKALRRLRDLELLQQRGTGAGSSYTLHPTVATPDGAQHRPRDFEAEILEIAARHPVTNAIVRGYTGLDRVAVVQLFNRLVADGRLERWGTKRGTMYLLPGAIPHPGDRGN